MNRLSPGAEDTIVALSTAPGRGAVALIRLSGVSAFAIAQKVVTPWPLPVRRATLCEAQDPVDGSSIDRLIVTTFVGPHSYTGDDTVEFSAHGGYAVADALLGALLHAGARQALPGEFTRRAVLNGKLDLLQAEAIGDLVDASSDAMRRMALRQLDGGLSRQINELRERLLDIEALLAYDIDFPEEDTGPLSRSRVSHVASSVSAALEVLLQTAPVTELVREGALVVIAGRPNVGKSSLFNALLGETRAIVTEVPGTTRDAIEARVDLGNWPVRIVDTAGLRVADELVERMGIEVSHRYLKHAHVVLLCEDDPAVLAAGVNSVRGLSTAPVLAVLTKCDQPGVDYALDSLLRLPLDSVHTSAHTRFGLTRLVSKLQHMLSECYGTIPTTQAALTRVRQRIGVEQALREIQVFEELWATEALPASIAAVHVRTAVGALEELVGAVDIEDVLGRLFATFCVGK